MDTAKGKIIAGNLDKHLAWKERIFNEATHSHKSLEKGIKMGIVDGAPATRNPIAPPSEIYYEDSMFQALLAKSSSKFPARNLLGFAVPPKGSLPDLSQLKKSRGSPFGLYPVISKKEWTFENTVNEGIFSPVRSSLRTYAGSSRLRIAYLHITNC